MNTLERALELLKLLRHDAPTQREIEAHLGIADSACRFYLSTLEQHGFITSTLSIDKQTKGRVPRVFALAPAWRGRVPT